MSISRKFSVEQTQHLARPVLWRLVGYVFACLVIPTPLGLAQDSPIVDSDEKTDIFILRQLIEIKNELRDFRREMGELRQTVSEIATTTTSAEVKDPSGGARLSIQLDRDDPVLGNREATVAIVEFTDYECPFCSQYHAQTFPKIKTQFVDTGKVQYIVRDFPLNFHANAKGAAIAANCAGEQDAYWQMKDVLFSKQEELGKELYRQAARSLRLNEDQFLACLKLVKQNEEVNADHSYGQEIGIDGTPTFFIGRVQGGQVVQATQIVGAQTEAMFLQTIKPLLENGKK